MLQVTHLGILLASVRILVVHLRARHGRVVILQLDLMPELRLLLSELIRQGLALCGKKVRYASATATWMRSSLRSEETLICICAAHQANSAGIALNGNLHSSAGFGPTGRHALTFKRLADLSFLLVCHPLLALQAASAALLVTIRVCSSTCEQLKGNRYWARVANMRMRMDVACQRSSVEYLFRYRYSRRSRVLRLIMAAQQQGSPL